MFPIIDEIPTDAVRSRQLSQRRPDQQRSASNRTILARHVSGDYGMTDAYIQICGRAKLSNNKQSAPKMMIVRKESRRRVIYLFGLLFELLISSIGPLTAATIDPAVIISGTNPNPRASCVTRSEATPEMTGGFGSMPVKIFATMGAQTNNFTANVWNAWQAVTKSVPKSSSIPTAGGDASAAFSPRGVLFSSVIGSTPAGRCIAIAATTESHMAAGTWDFPLACLASPDASTDGPVIDTHPTTGRSLWAVEREGSKIKLTIAPNCNFGQPGSAACPVGSTAFMPNGDFPGGQATVSVNQCTGNGVVAYWSSDNKVRLDIRRPNGTQVKNYVVASNLRRSINTGCTNGSVRLCPTCECRGAGCVSPTNPKPCSRSLTKPQVIVNFTGSRCLAYVTYDQSRVASDAKEYFKSYLHIIDLGTSSSSKETAPTELKAWVTSSGRNPWNQWQPTLTTSLGTGKIGWFWYSDIRGACRVVFEGAVDSLSGTTNMAATGAISQEFPNVRFFDTAGLGDYVMGIRRARDGFLYPSWSQSLGTTSSSTSCNACGTTRYSKAIFMSRVLP
jgi:hypothetical protein